ncbi:MAG: hypothetical protein WD184_02755 [Acidimicrobiia bacterium]
MARPRELAGGLGALLAGISVRTVSPDRFHNNWAWLVGGLFGGLAIHSMFDVGSGRLLAVAGAAIALVVGRVLEWRIIRRASPHPRGGRKALGITQSHLVVFRRPGIGGRAIHVVASAPLDEVVAIRVDNGGWDWLRWLLTFAGAAVVVASEFVAFSVNLLLVGVILLALLASVVGSTGSSGVWVLFGDGRQWKFSVRAAEWFRFHSEIPGFKWRGSGDGMRNGSGVVHWTFVPHHPGQPNR